MCKAIEEFIIRRINDHNMAELEALQELFQQFNDSVEALRAVLPIEMNRLLRQCGDSYALLDEKQSTPIIVPGSPRNHMADMGLQAFQNALDQVRCLAAERRYKFHPPVSSWNEK